MKHKVLSKYALEIKKKACIQVCHIHLSEQFWRTRKIYDKKAPGQFNHTW